MKYILYSSSVREGITKMEQISVFVIREGFPKEIWKFLMAAFQMNLSYTGWFFLLGLPPLWKSSKYGSWERGDSKYLNIFNTYGGPVWDSNVFLKSVTYWPTLSKFRGGQLIKTPCITLIMFWWTSQYCQDHTWPFSVSPYDTKQKHQNAPHPPTQHAPFCRKYGLVGLV